jgi:hypothetical protein
VRVRARACARVRVCCASLRWPAIVVPQLVAACAQAETPEQQADAPAGVQATQRFWAVKGKELWELGLRVEVSL